MGIRDVRHAGEVFRPRNLLKEVKRVRDVTLDLAALGRVEVAFANRQNARLFRIEQRTILAAKVGEFAPGQLLQILELAIGQHRRFIRLRDEGEVFVQPFDFVAQLGINLRGKRFVSIAAVRDEVIDLSFVRIILGRLAHEIEARTNRVELQRIKLLLLDQHLFANADFAEVMQQRRVADLANLIGAESHGFV